jgi:HEPN domain-containing protein
MTKQDHIAHWLNTATEDEITMNLLYKDGRYTHCLFFGHLYIEKIYKAIWIKNNKGNTPPYIHNLIRILQGIEVGLSDEQYLFMEILNKYQLSGRYADYTNDLKKRTSKELTMLYINRINELDTCLRKNL